MAEFELTPLQALNLVNNDLSGGESQDASLRAVNFMSYELATLCDNKTDEEVFQILNNFFFQIKNFKISTSPFLLDSVLNERNGCGIAVALLYLHLARTLDLDVHLVHWPLHTILKWENQGSAQFLDLSQGGRFLSADEILEIVNIHKEQVRTLSMSESLVQYLTYISMNYRQSQELEQLHKVLNLILKIEPENTRHLSERALLRRDLGLHKEALCDLKRFFSFIDKNSASPQLVETYENYLAGTITYTS
jgi:regulator of sirC expression with transglutaminase-like and TPR domain